MSVDGEPHRSLRVWAVIDSLEQGGAERSLVTLLGPLRERDVSVDIVTLRGGGPLSDEARSAGADVVTLDPGTRGRRIDALRRMLVDGRPDLVHTTLFESHLVGRTAARAARVPVTSSVVNTPYGPDHLHERGLRPSRVRAAQVLDAATAQAVARFHSPAAHVARTMARRLAVPIERFDVVPRGRDPDVLGRRTADRRRKARVEFVDDDRPLLLLAAREEPLKGIDVAIDALGEWSPGSRPRLLVAGRRGTASDDLRARVERAGFTEDVLFLGYRSDVADLLCAADVALLPSSREGLPGVLVEALALETPIVASDLPGIREVVGAETGVLVPAGQSQALAEAVRSVLDHPSAASERARSGRIRFEERYTIDRAADGMAAFFRRAVP